MPQDRRGHWDEVYALKPADKVSWFQSEPVRSLAMIATAGIGPDDPIVDVGGGASLLVDRLLDRGFRHVTVLDIAQNGLAVAQARLGARQSQVTWLVQDVTRWQPPLQSVALWHDRAVFHFLVDPEDRRRYLEALDRALRPGGFVIIASFALTGPEKCSGLPVQRYSAETLQAALGPGYRRLDLQTERHATPAGGSQDFLWCLFGRNDEPATRR
jgi:ubiquinone/menaquinone biosynthesis C-methylase UbiE